ncbi:integrator complex subunit 9-like [Plakobranchus ocellatus]|uniref:Integrator complex subunit 9-like n=1 Tax=Plakobranchus ocellatus TaxID=259542 RepID=A0AAV3Z8H5_9GAST|nr:integrator complex subunit 9-like [Plakobranchus ocellatus]
MSVPDKVPDDYDDVSLFSNESKKVPQPAPAPYVKFHIVSSSNSVSGEEVEPKASNGELVKYVERNPKTNIASHWKQDSFTRNLPAPLRDAINPRRWEKLYTQHDVDSALAKVKLVGFSEKLDIFGALTITPTSSGYCIGSCNWIINSKFEKICYVADLLTELSLDCHECLHDILAPVRKSFHHPASNLSHEFVRVQSVHSPELIQKYLERRKDMKSNGYPDSLVSDTIAFVPIENRSQIELLCKEGIKCGNQKVSGLGVPHMAVHACKHADIIAPMKPKAGEKVLLVVKVMKMYLYEYGDFDVEEYPRHVLPFAVIYYNVKEPQQSLPSVINSSPHVVQSVLSSSASIPGSANTLSRQGKQEVASSVVWNGPRNEVWRGRLHIRLIEGGHIFIDVSMFSYYVPLTVNIMSPIKVHNLFPEHNAQFTFLSGLSNLAEQAEVEWRAHYFRSFLLRPRSNNEHHFQALIKHISVKREMPTVKLPNDVFLFLMPNCLLASQLGFVRREDNAPVLHCVLMSKFSTSEVEKKKLASRKCPLPNYGTAKSWEELFDDSDFSDDDDDVNGTVHATDRETQAHLAQVLPIMFNDQHNIQNKFAAMSIADAEVNLSPCSCRHISTSKSHRQQYRDADVQRILAALQSVARPSQKPPVMSHFPPGSRHKPKVKVSHRTKNMPSFSPHGSSDSDSDPENGHRSSKKTKGHLSLLHSTKTVEEELSEEELTNEQMEDIIFMRKKPAQAGAGVPRTKHEPALSLKFSKHIVKKEPSETAPIPRPQASPLSPIAPFPSQLSDNDFERREYKEPLLLSEPKIIPTEPVEQPNYSSPVGSPTKEAGLVHIPDLSSKSKESSFIVHDNITVSSGSITQGKSKFLNLKSLLPAMALNRDFEFRNVHESLKDAKGSNSTHIIPHNTEKARISSTNSLSFPEVSQHSVVSSLCKSSCEVSASIVSSPSFHTTSVTTTGIKTCAVAFSQKQEIGNAKAVQLPAQSETQAFHNEEALDFGDVDMRVPSHRNSTLNPVFLSTPADKPSANLSFGMWLAPSEIVAPSHSALYAEAALSSPSSPSSPISLPVDSPPSPTDSPASPPLESPASPLPPASPTEVDQESPMSPPPSSSLSKFRSTPIAIPTSRLEHQSVSPEINYLQRQSLFVAQSLSTYALPALSGVGIDNANDMKDFLNDGFNSDLDSSYEDDR